MSTSGAMGGILADGAQRYGVQLAQLSDSTRTAVQAIPGISGSLNPLDVAMATFAGDFGVVGQLAGMLAADPGVDAVLLAVSGLPYSERLVDDCASTLQGTGKLFVPLWAGDHADLGLAVPRLAQRGITVFETCEDAVRALGALTQWQRHQATLRDRGQADAHSTLHSVPQPVPQPVPHLAPHEASRPEPHEASHGTERRAKARTLLAKHGAGSTALTEYHSKQLLALYGIAIPNESVATDAEAAVRSAERIGFPVALKIHSPGILHKTEAGGLQLALADAAAVRAAFAAVMASAAAHHPQARLDGVLVAPMAAPGIEMVIGAATDAQFGPVLVAGMGGVLVEVLRDTALRVAPLTQRDALAMLAELRGTALLDGVRGRGPADRAAVVQVLLALSTLMEELGGAISAIDINPLVVHARGQGVSVVDALVVLAPPMPVGT